MSLTRGRAAAPISFIPFIALLVGALALAFGADTASAAGQESPPDAETLAIAGGYAHSLTLKADGSLWAWGNGQFGQLGTGGTKNVFSPMRVTTDRDWTRVAAGGIHSLALKDNGILYAWGDNSFGQLGDTGVTGSLTPLQVKGSNWTAVASGVYHSMGLKADGSLWAWGSNGYGQRGDGSSGITLPTRVSADNDWKAVVCGAYHTLALKANGSLWAWGYNGDGQLGDGGTVDKPTPTQIGSARDWVAVAAGQYHTVALKADGTLWAWGDNAYGQLGDTTTTDRHAPVQVGAARTWTALACGDWHTLALDGSNYLWTWGRNNDGQLGQGHTDADPHPAPTQVLPLETARWRAVAAGGMHGLAVREDGGVLAWGDNAHGQVGDGTSTDKPAPLQIMGSGAVRVFARAKRAPEGTAAFASAGAGAAIRSDGSLRTWGDNWYYQLGWTGEYDGLSPGLVSTGTTAAVATGSSQTIALSSRGFLYAWGANTYGELGDGTTTLRSWPTLLPAGSDWSAVSAGGQTSAGLRGDGTLWTWGKNTSGQLGQGTSDWDPHSTPAQVGTDDDWVTVSCGSQHVAAIKADGTLWAWGANQSGQLGRWTTDWAPVLTPMQVGADSDWKAVACGALHTVALKADGSLWVWGSNAHGQLGAGGVDEEPHPLPQRVGSGSGWVRLASGSFHVLAAEADGTLWAWGSNSYGQLGDGSGARADLARPTRVGSASTWTAVAAGGDMSAAVDSQGVLWAFGARVGEWLGPDAWTDQPAAGFALWDCSEDPTVTALTSPTHVDEDAWYATRDFVVEWAAEADSWIEGYSLTLDRVADTDPDTVIDTAATGQEFAALEDGLWHLHVRAADAGHNWSPTVHRTIRIDGTPPTTNSIDDSYWRRETYTARFYANDLGSGMTGGAATTQYSLDGGLTWIDGTSVTFRTWKRGGGSGIYELLFRSIDAVGNVEPTHTAEIKIDARPPRTTDDAPRNAAGQPIPRNGEVTVALSATDTLSGVQATWYSLDGSEWVQGDRVLVPAEPGVHWIAYYSADWAYNYEGVRWCSVEILPSASAQRSATRGTSRTR